MACDLRSKKLGYAVFEFPSEMQLVDWGSRRFYERRGSKPALADLLHLIHPSVLVMRKFSTGSSRESAHIGKMVSKVVKEARVTKTPIAWLSEERLTQFFEKSGITTKQQVAASMAELFPEIAWKLPSPRKSWQPEHWRMPLFDAIALGFGYFVLKMGPTDANRMITLDKPFQRLPRDV